MWGRHVVINIPAARATATAAAAAAAYIRSCTSSIMELGRVMLLEMLGPLSSRS